MERLAFDHIHLRSPDPEAAARIWQTAFGAEITARTQAGPWLRIVLSLAGVTLFVEQVPAATSVPPPPPFQGIEHLGLRVPDLDAALADLAAKGVPVLAGPSAPRPGVRIAFVGLPDGVRVELIERRA